jgi:hypothetical protein
MNLQFTRMSPVDHGSHLRGTAVQKLPYSGDSFTKSNKEYHI